MLLSGFADDLTIMIRDEEDLRKALEIIEDFGRASGLKINIDKSEIMCFGDWSGVDTRVPQVNMAKITGVTMGKREVQEEINEANFGVAVTKLERTLLQWKTRALSLVGRVLIVKALGLSQIQFLASSTRVPEAIVDRIIKLVYNFIWCGKNKIIRERAAKRWEEGGIKMPMVEDCGVCPLDQKSKVEQRGAMG